MIAARQLIGERLATVTPTLPSWSTPPVMLQPLSSTSRTMKIGALVRHPRRHRAVPARALEDPPSAHAGPGRGQRRDLGPAQRAAPCARRPGSSRRQRDHAPAADDRDRRRVRRRAPQVHDRRLGWHRRVRRDAESAPGDPARPAGRERPGAAPGRRGRGRRPDPARGRCGGRRDQPPAAHRRRRHQRRRGTAAHRREVSRGRTRSR